MFEEREVVSNALKEGTSILLETPKDLSDLFKYLKGERKITSLMVIPISFQGKFTNALSAALMDETHAFEDKDLQLLSTFANHACIAMENTFLLAKVRKMETVLGAYDQNLKNIQNGLQGLAKRETRHIEENISRFIPKTENAKLFDYNQACPN
jgi:GAF domain-containing protein